MIKFLFPLFFLLSSNAYAELYFELDLEGGGDTLIGSTAGQNINVGGGIKFALGVQNVIGENGESLSLSLGYLFDNLDAFNGTAEIDVITFDAIYSIQSERHRFGIGGSYHLGPTYEDDVFGFLPLKVDFDDAFGLILQYSYSLYSGFQIGARFTIMDYKVSGLTLDAGSFGIFFSNGF